MEQKGGSIPQIFSKRGHDPSGVPVEMKEELERLQKITEGLANNVYARGEFRKVMVNAEDNEATAKLIIHRKISP